MPESPLEIEIRVNRILLIFSCFFKKYLIFIAKTENLGYCCLNLDQSDNWSANSEHR